MLWHINISISSTELDAPSLYVLLVTHVPGNCPSFSDQSWDQERWFFHSQMAPSHQSSHRGWSTQKYLSESPYYDSQISSSLRLQVQVSRGAESSTKTILYINKALSIKNGLVTSESVLTGGGDLLRAVAGEKEPFENLCLFWSCIKQGTRYHKTIIIMKNWLS